ncbi:MAG: DegV family protein [Clostridia bacterium]|nr:DegV family protein [Clostridia bacterium]
MKTVQIITDSCSDLTPELMGRYGIDYAKMNTVYQGKEAPADLSWTPESVRELYGIMRNGGRVTTTQVPAGEFERIFREYAAKDRDIVYISCSEKQSGSINTARLVAQDLQKEFPGTKILCVDSKHASLGEGVLAIEAAKYAADGKSAEQTVAFTEEKRKYLHQFCTVHSLDALKRAGRVKATSAFFGNLLGVKPILVADADGVQAAYKKSKGRLGSLEEIVSLLKEHIVDPENQTVYLAHSDCDPAEVKTVKELILKSIPCRELFVGYIGPIIGASIGPDAFALFGFGDEITFRASED